MALEMAVAYQAAPVVATQAASAMAAFSAYMGTLAAESAVVATTSTVATVGTTTLLSTVLLPVTVTVVGISVVGVAAKYFMSSATETTTKTEAKQDTKEKEKKKDRDNPEIHQAWSNLSSYRGKTKKGVTNKNNVYYYEKDYTHGDVEVYQKLGSKGLHIGSVSMQGGQLTKSPVPGRTIDL